MIPRLAATLSPIAAVFAGWGVSEFNQLAGAFAFAAAGIYSIAKTVSLARDRRPGRDRE